MKAMILAAGRGERMRPLTDTTPKALLRVGNRPLIEHHLESLVQAGIREIVINVAWLGRQIMDHLGDGQRFGVKIQWSDEGDSALETGGGIARALPLLGSEPFWVVNGDVFAQCAYTQPQLAPEMLGHLLLVPNPDHNPQGDFALAGTCIENTGSVMYTYSGIAYLHPALFDGNAGGKFPLAPLFRAAARRGLLSGELLQGHWIDVGTPARLQALSERVSASRGPGR